ncbi:MAG: hypothetical protein AAF441_15430 [Pseudomonadota bacterium]
MPITQKTTRILKGAIIAAAAAIFVSGSFGLQMTPAEAGASSKRGGVSSFASAGGLGTTRIRTRRGRRN